MTYFQDALDHVVINPKGWVEAAFFSVVDARSFIRQQREVFGTMGMSLAYKGFISNLTDEDWLREVQNFMRQVDGIRIPANA